MLPVVLAIETSGRRCSAAVAHAGRVESRRAEVGHAHSDHVLAMVDAVLACASLRLVDCAAVAFGAGPGSFTGLRVACAVAQGLAYGAGIKVVPVGTLDALAAAARAATGGDVAPAGSQPLLVAQDARMGELYWALDDGSQPARVTLSTPQGLRRALAGRAPLACGTGNAWSVFGDALDGLVARVVPQDAPDAAEVARLGLAAHLAGRCVEPGDARPLYVRDRVAETTEQRAARAREAATR